MVVLHQNVLPDYLTPHSSRSAGISSRGCTARLRFRHRPFHELPLACPSPASPPTPPPPCSRNALSPSAPETTPPTAPSPIRTSLAPPDHERRSPPPDESPAAVIRPPSHLKLYHAPCSYYYGDP